MAHLYSTSAVHRKDQSLYRDSKFDGSHEDQESALARSTTLYVGNLSFFTTEEQIYELFSRAGRVRRVIMGLDRIKKTPCGFCFVEYEDRASAEACVKYINGTKLDERIIRADWDAGFKEGRQFGRGRHGGQVRDEHRSDYDAGRGGYGAKYRAETQQNVFSSFDSTGADSSIVFHGDKRKANGSSDADRAVKRQRTPPKTASAAAPNTSSTSAAATAEAGGTSDATTTATTAPSTTTTSVDVAGDDDDDDDEPTDRFREQEDDYN
eukprot:TRINITY_DN66979_c8_g7_i1.p1 TRINITY_DN66979_c8_g7~~TRINITY_DN66979_c8_g7_i1.p1  ORF type:complete len:266 (-),score=119.07 TRINITY_DN66979_c8_g7_i1:28-825(-)